ncbi:helix-turn-helix transcriptional regulator [Methylobacterium sp. WSM2598]|uniref:helix-turn-helix transcriptional regulator n=1 Tax=Methylobacterium sp. WSM2598 TaxID=398261 RepID=UPI000373512C|nr:helix-turn-helix transcriptional regulator [Methylobacterium sp. WSM2598]
MWQPDETQVERIYEAAIVPDLWPAILESIAEALGMVGGALVTLPSSIPPLVPRIDPRIRWTTSAAVAPMFHAFFTEGWATRCTWVQRGRALGHPFFISDDDIMTRDELMQMPSYPFYRGYGVGWAAGLFMRIPSGDVFTFTFDRRYEDGPVPAETVAALNTLRPHLARAAMIAARLGLERARATTETLAILGLPAAVLSESGALIDANPHMRARMPSCALEGARGAFHLRDAGADALLQTALAAIRNHAPAGSAVMSIPVPPAEGQPPAVAHVVPIRGAARDLYTPAASLVVLTPLCQRDPPPAAVIQGLFDLTAAEARVARFIAQGQTVSDVATKSGTSEATVRTQLKAVFAKIGVSRQAELVSLLGNTLGLTQARA